MEEAEDVDAAVSKLAAQPSGTPRVIMPVTLARSSVAPKLAAFLQHYPELRIEISLRGGQLNPIAEHVERAVNIWLPRLPCGRLRIWQSTLVSK